MAVISLLLFAATVLASPGHLKLDFSKKAVADPNLQARSAGSVDVPLTQSADKIVRKSSAYAGSLFLLTFFFCRNTPSISPLERLLNHLHCSLTPAAVIFGCLLLTQVLVKAVTVVMGRSTRRNHLPSK
jgi:hypothetical protein